MHLASRTVAPRALHAARKGLAPGVYARSIREGEPKRPDLGVSRHAAKSLRGPWSANRDGQRAALQCVPHRKRIQRNLQTPRVAAISTRHCAWFPKLCITANSTRQTVASLDQSPQEARQCSRQQSRLERPIVRQPPTPAEPQHLTSHREGRFLVLTQRTSKRHSVWGQAQNETGAN